MTKNFSFPVVIPAAGIGSRMAASKAKQYLLIQNKTILEHTLDLFINANHIGPIVVVVHPEDQIFADLPIASNPQIQIVTGGQERVDSVLAGLQFLQDQGFKNEFVLVHDAARPCLEKKELNKLIDECLVATINNNILGAILACPVSDTIKKSALLMCNTINNESLNESLPIIEQTIDRETLWQAQTPQMFRVNELFNAIELGLSQGNKLTDEASAIESIGKQVLLVEGTSSNLKITRPSDLALASFYISNRDLA